VFDVGSLEGRIELDRTPFLAGLRAARMEGQRFEREQFTATAELDLDTRGATVKAKEFRRANRQVHADFDLDVGAAEAKILALKRQAAGIGGGIGGGVGGVGGGGGGSSIFGSGGFFKPSVMAMGIGGAATFAPTIGASAVQGALGAGALGTGILGAGAVGLSSIIATAAPAISALKAATEAEKAYTAAVATYGKHSTEAHTAQKKLNAATDALAPSAERAMDAVDRLKGRWGELSKPAQTQFFGMVNDAMREAERLMPMFAQIAEEDVGAARDALDHFLGAMNSPDFRTFVNVMGDLFATSVGPMERSIENVLHVLGRIAVAVAPDVLQMFEDIQQTTHEWEKDTRNAGELRDHVHETVGEFGAWVDLAGSLGGLLSSLFITNNRGARTGKQEVEAMADQLDRWSNWLDHHHGEVNRFFSTLHQTFGLLLDSAGEIAKVVLPAFKPVADVIHEIVSDLNSVKVGNVSALTVLLGIMVGRSMMGKLGLGAAGGAAGAGAAGLTMGEAAGAGAAGGAGAVSLGSRIAALLPEGRGLLPIGGAGPAAAAAVAFQSLAGKPGTFLGPGIAGFAPDDKEVRQQLKGVLRAERDYHDASLNQLYRFRDRARGAWLLTFESDPEGAISEGGNVLEREARQTFAHIDHMIRGVEMGSKIADAVAEGGPDVRKTLRRYTDAFESLPPAVQDAAQKSAKQELDQLQEMGLITKRQEQRTLKQLEDLQQDSQRKQRKQWDRFGAAVNRNVAGWFGSMTHTVDTLLGNKGITGMVNQLLTGVASQKKLEWNATTAGRVVGTLSGYLGIGGQRGGFTGGYSTHDDRLVPLRGNEAVLRGEDHVPLVSAALQRTYGFTLGDLFARTGGRVNGAMGRPSTRGVSTGFARGGLNFALGPYDIPPIQYDANHSHATGNSHLHISGTTVPWTAAIGRQMSGMGWAIGEYARTGLIPGSTGLTTTHADPGHYDGRAFDANTAQDETRAQVAAVARILGGSGAGVGGAVQRLPRIVVHGPKGAARDGLQGIANLSRNAANHYLMQNAGAGSRVDVGAGSLSRSEMRRLIAAHHLPDLMGWVAYSESGFNPRAVSSAGARGLWQIMPFWGGGDRLFDPNYNAEKARHVLDVQGYGAWSPSEYAGQGGGWGQHRGEAFARGGFAGWHKQGLDAIVRGRTLIGVGEDYSRERVKIEPLDRGRPSSVDNPPKLIVHGDIITDRQAGDVVEWVIGDRRFPIAVQREISGRHSHGRQLARMRR
jgi:hypothetical protein